MALEVVVVVEVGALSLQGGWAIMWIEGGLADKTDSFVFIGTLYILGFRVLWLPARICDFMDSKLRFYTCLRVPRVVVM